MVDKSCITDFAEVRPIIEYFSLSVLDNCDLPFQSSAMLNDWLYDWRWYGLAHETKVEVAKLW